MRAVTISRPGGPEVLVETDLPDPVPAHGEVLIEVAAAGVNRADVHQREGGYPPPSGAPDWPGLEVSGIVSALGDGVTDVALGDRVCALLPGGGYAELAIATAGQVLPVPETIDLVEAAALPEAIATVWSNVFMTASLRAGETLLVHGGSSGIGTMAIQLAKQLGARVACTVGSAEKAEFCRGLGANLAINYRDEDFVEEVRRLEPAGANVILDVMGAAYLPRNLDCLATEGRLVVIGLQGGTKGELDLGTLLRKRAAVLATALRSRSREEKAAIVASVADNVWPLITDGTVRPIVDRRFALDEAAQAHEYVESGSHIGKVLLTVG